MTARCLVRNGHIQCERPAGHRNLHQAVWFDENGKRRFTRWDDRQAVA